MNRKEAKIIPKQMATVISTKTVSKKAVSKIAISLAGALNNLIKCPISLIFQATIIRIAERAGKGMYPIRGDKKRTINKRVAAWIIPAIGVLPPDLTLIAVL